MGLHLELYVLKGLADLAAGTVFPMTKLSVIENMELNRQLVDVSAFDKKQDGVVPVVAAQPVLRGFAIEETSHDDHTCKFDADYYGHPLRWLYALDFAAIKLTSDPDMGYASSVGARAALAYIAALPPNTPVVLYWT